MTTKEMLTAVINGTINDEVKAKAVEMLASAEKKNSKRVEQSAEIHTANLAIAKVIKSKMANRTYGASEIVTLIADEYPDIKTAKITAVMADGIKANMFTVINDYKIGGKGRKVNGYAKAVTETTDETETADETETK